MTELYIAFQRLLPKILLGRFIHWLSRLQTVWLKNLLINGFTRLYAVRLDEAERQVPDGYASFNDFFTRSLKPGLREPNADPRAICSPVDGTIQHAGRLSAGTMIQAKGLHYDLDELLGDSDSAADYRDGYYLTVYLAPYDYHRVHAPVSGRLHAMHYVPGDRWAVNPVTASSVPRLFARNERLACHFKAAWGSFAVVLVGALNVASISTAWAGEVLPCSPRSPRHWRYPGQAGVALDRGEYLGHFNLGSTVIVLLPASAGTLDAELRASQKLQVGQRVGLLNP
jgi:phosphatidylserine decarboxylase